MERLRMFLWSVMFAAVLTGVFLFLVRLNANYELNAKLSRHETLRSGIRELCVTGTDDQFERASMVVAKANQELHRLQLLNGQGPVGDFVTPDTWDFVEPIVIPTDAECLSLKRASRVRQCELFMRADWQAEFDREGCGELLARR